MALPNNRSSNEIVVTADLADIATATACYAVAPVKGQLKRVYSVVEGTTNGANVISIAINGATALAQVIDVASGATAGEVDSAEFPVSALTFCPEGAVLSATSDGVGSTTVVARFHFVIEQH